MKLKYQELLAYPPPFIRQAGAPGGLSNKEGNFYHKENPASAGGPIAARPCLTALKPYQCSAPWVRSLPTSPFMILSNNDS